MVLRPLSQEIYQWGEKYQLGTPVGLYPRHITLSGKVAFTGIFLLFLTITGTCIILIYGSSTTLSVSSPAFSLMDFSQIIFLTGVLLSTMRYEKLISPLHLKLFVAVYTEGLLVYHKGHKIRVVRWEEIQSIQRQFTVHRRKRKIVLIRPAYLCEVSQQPNLVLSAAISNVNAVGVFIERELTKRLLPEVQADYQAHKSITFSNISLTSQYISDYKKDFTWSRVSRIEVGPENLTIEQDNNPLDVLTVPLSDISNLCILVALLEHIQQEKGFDLFLETAIEVQNTELTTMLGEKRNTRRPRKTSWVSSLVLVTLALLVVSAEIFSTVSNIYGGLPPPLFAPRHYPALLVSNPPLPPQAGLPYTSKTVYDAFLAAGLKTSNVLYANGWACCVFNPQPEGRIVLWEEGYGVVLEIATFANPIEVGADAYRLSKNSEGYVVYTRNLCLFFYDDSISKAHLSDYIRTMSAVCT